MAILCIIILSSAGTSSRAEQRRKTAGVFYSPRILQMMRQNAKRLDWGRKVRDQLIKAAEPWMKMSDDELWSLMFGPTITRSWMVWSNGYCPSCKVSVPMYSWKINALAFPWKARCPHCGEFFPKNDFKKYYDSGLDEHAIFDPAKADRSLLFNEEHPDPGDPLHRFGVDDGEGYVEGDKRWRFIGAYLVYGQWKQVVYGGAVTLAKAYAVTGDPAYAHKAGILLDRIADLYPGFRFARQGLVYEQPGVAGYVSTWHDACEETRELALAYDAVFEAISRDEKLAAFLSRKALEHKIAKPKDTPAAVCANIEDGILKEALANREQIHSNYPRTEIAVATIMTILGWPENRDEILAILDPMLDKSTAVDGVTGEKGLAGYSAFTISGVATLLEQYARMDEAFFTELLERHPRIRDMFRFHIDTHCLGRYYPQSGDTGRFVQPSPSYVGAVFARNFDIGPSMFSLFWRLYQHTGDPAFVQTLYRANGKSLDGLPYDILAPDPQAFQKSVKEVIERNGPEPALGSVNKQEWHLAILRSGKGNEARALWLDYDSGGAHGHHDGMNLGLFAKGLDLMPELGYPAVHFGGWGAPRALWYGMTASHNTVMIDGRNTEDGAGKTTLWADGNAFRAIRASGPGLYGVRQYERTAAMIDISQKDSYIIDLFRVVGGREHTKFMHSHFSSLSTNGLSLEPAEDFTSGTQMRNFACDLRPRVGWSADWKVEDRLGLVPERSEIHLRYTDLTLGAEVYTAEGWLAMDFNSSEEAWIPRLLIRRRASAGELASTFLGTIEPYEGSPNIIEARRLALHTAEGARLDAATVAVEVRLAGGERDLFISIDKENPLGKTPSGRMIIQREWNATFEGDTCWIRKDRDGKIARISICNPGVLRIKDITVKLKEGAEFVEVVFCKGRAEVVAGDPQKVEIQSSETDLHKAERGDVMNNETVIRIPASYYQQFDADLSLDVPAEGYGGWKKTEIEISPLHTAVVVMHAWDCGTPEEFPGWYRCVEYIPRAKEICQTVFPRLLSAVRSSPLKLFHVVSGSGYYEHYPGYRRALRLAGSSDKPKQAQSDPIIERLRQFRAENVFVGKHNQADVERGLKRLDFAPEARPVGDEGIAATSEQLFALCKEAGINHLIYVGFAIDGCLLLSPGGISDMSRHGMMCSTIRQAVTAIENKETARRELAKEIALWRVALLYGFVFDAEDFIAALESLT